MIVNTLRVLRLKLLCKEVGRGCLLDKDITVVHGEYVSIGSGCTIHKDTLLHVAAKNKDAKEPILKIGSNCHLSFRTWIAARIGITIGDDTGFATATPTSPSRCTFSPWWKNGPSRSARAASWPPMWS